MSKSSNFQFQQFLIRQDKTAMKVGIDSVLLGSWCPLKNEQRILDIGTGTGILSLMLAQRSQALIDAVEIENSAYHQAEENIDSSIFAERINVFHTAIQDFHPLHRYDLIISNPPYFEASLKANSQSRTQARHDDSLTHYELLTNAKRLLYPNGSLALILPIGQEDKVRQTAKELGFFVSNFASITGKEGKAANRMLLVLKLNTCQEMTEEINIYSSDGKYSPEFNELTKNFYLSKLEK